MEQPQKEPSDPRRKGTPADGKGAPRLPQPGNPLDGRGPASAAAAGSWLWPVFFALSAVGGAPPLTYGQSRPVLSALFLAAAAVTLIPSRGRLHLPRGWPGIGGFAGLATLALPGLMLSDPLPALDYLADLGRSALVFCCFHHLARTGGDRRAIARTLPLVAAFAGGAVVLVAGELRDWTNPCLQLGGVVFEAGFYDRATHWAAGLAYALPVAAFFGSGSGAAKTRPRRSAPISFAMAAAVLLAVFLSGSRSGLLLSAAALGGLLLVRATRRRSAGLIVLVSVWSLYAVSSPPCVRHFKLGWVASAVTGEPPEVRRPGEPDLGGVTDASEVRFRALDELSTGRLTGVRSGLALLRERPLFGYGIGRALIPGEGGEERPVHNLWLRWALDVGVLPPLLFLGMIGAILRRGRSALRSAADDRRRGETAALGLVLVQGLLVSMLEPHALIGNFDVSALWWAAAGALLGRAAPRGVQAGSGSNR